MSSSHAATTSSTKTCRRVARIVWLSFRGLVALSAFAFGFFADWKIPNRHLPWAILDIAEPVGPMTRVKLGRAEGVTCRTILGNGGLRFREVQTQRSGEFCSKEDAVVLDAGLAPLLPKGAVMTCNQALAVALWERQVVQPAAERHFGQKVSRIDHYGTYACRRIYGASTGRVSQHASANAIDIASFTLADGRRVSVLRDWKDAGAEGAFLREVHGGACQVFDVALGPDYNAAHRDHLHLDMGRGPFCR